MVNLFSSLLKEGDTMFVWNTGNVTFEAVPRTDYLDDKKIFYFEVFLLYDTLSVFCSFSLCNFDSILECIEDFEIFLKVLLGGDINLQDYIY